VRQPESPSLPPGAEGIRIQFAPAPAPAERRLVIFGTCALAADSALQLTDTLLDNVSIVCSFGKELATVAFPLTRRTPVFEDDIQVGAALHAAWFRVDLADRGVPPRRGPYFVVAALGTHVSNVATLDWN
jgi:hypothetical protein